MCHNAFSRGYREAGRGFLPKGSPPPPEEKGEERGARGKVWFMPKGDLRGEGIEEKGGGEEGSG